MRVVGRVVNSKAHNHWSGEIKTIEVVGGQRTSTSVKYRQIEISSKRPLDRFIDTSLISYILNPIGIGFFQNLTN
jgi:hypothetical protein